MSQAEQLDTIFQSFIARVPAPVQKKLLDPLDKAIAEFDPSKCVKVGDKLPAFRMPDATGKEVTSEELLAAGPLLITFYRGEWCPFCNIAVANLQKHLPEFQAHGVTLVAISPELPNTNLSTAEKHALQYPVLTDSHNEFAKKLNIIYDQSAAREPHQKMGVDIVARTGDDSYEVPFPATLLVDQSGVVREAYVDPDYRKRLDPGVAVEWVKNFQK